MQSEGDINMCKGGGWRAGCVQWLWY